MKYQKFTECIEKEVKEKLNGECEVVLVSTIKNNDTICVGLRFEVENEVKDTLYLEEAYQEYQEGKTLEEIVDQTIELYREKELKSKKLIPLRKDLKNYSFIKNKIVYKIIGLNSNRLFLKDIIYKTYLDFAIVPFVFFDTKDSHGSMMITENMLKIWDVNEEEIFRVAEENTPKIFPSKVSKISEFMMVLTNEQYLYGASAIFYEGVKEKIFEELKVPYYILPSSLHELIIVPYTFGASPEELLLMVEDVNNSDRSPEEILTESVYLYEGMKLVKVV